MHMTSSKKPQPISTCTKPLTSRNWMELAEDGLRWVETGGEAKLSELS